MIFNTSSADGGLLGDTDFILVNSQELPVATDTVGG